jgi:hypothetical protein
LAGDFDGTIGAVIVYENADVNQVGQFPDGCFQRLFRVVSGKHDGNAFAVNHAVISSKGCLNDKRSCGDMV